MREVVAAVLLLGACSFVPRAAGQADGGDAASGPGIDAPDGGGSGSGSGSGSTARRKPIVIDKNKVGGPLDDFPVWIDLTDAQIAARARADGTDIYFTDASGVALDHEIEAWSGGRLLAWVRAPHLDSNANVTLYVAYGDVTRAVAANPAGVFRAYVAVWHLDDTLASTSVADATGMHAATAAGLSASSQVAGKLGGAFAFDGSNSDKVTFTNPLTGNGPHTISAWVNQASTTQYSAIVTVGTNANDQARFLYGNYLNSGTLAFGQYGDDWVPGGNDLRGAGWKLVTASFEGSNKKIHVFVDGAEIGGSPHTLGAQAATAAGTGYIGGTPSGFGNPTEMNGVLDEVRIATAARPPGWPATEFANQSAPAMFYAVGAEELAP